MKTAMITGAAEGQGFDLALKLDAMGWKVFAGVLPGLPTEKLTSGNSNITPVVQDVSNTDSVRESAKLIWNELSGTGLNLLVNNAGIANLAQGVTEGLDLEKLKDLFEINTYGQLRTIQAFLPMLRKAAPHARILNYSSGAVVANPPGAVAYTMSKHAVVGLTLTLRHELAALGVQATSILPGGVKTAMTKDAHKTTHEIWNRVSKEIQAVYKPFLFSATTKTLPDLLEKHGNTIEYMTEKLIEIIHEPKLKPLYLVGKDVKPLGFLRRWLSDVGLESMVRKTYKIPSKL